MKLALTIENSRGASHDVSLTCDASLTVAETARAIMRSTNFGDASLSHIAATRSESVTLLARASESSEYTMLDPGAPLITSGLRSGWVILPTVEFGGTPHIHRMQPIVGYLEVLTGAHTAKFYSLICGVNTLGRDKNARIYLSDRSVSRRHAVIEVRETEHLGLEIWVRDLGSANGVVIDGRRVRLRHIDDECEIEIGDVRVRLTPLPAKSALPDTTDLGFHTPSPRLDARFPNSVRELPAPPAQQEGNRIPMLALLAPAFMGGALYLTTGSPMSLLMMVFSPLMMIGSWVDGKVSGRRRDRRQISQFREQLEQERSELAQLAQLEIQARVIETPGVRDVRSAITQRSTLLWTRRPEHQSFLELRLGEGRLPSRTGLTPPNRSETRTDFWREIQQLIDDFESVSPVPVTEQLTDCGSIGVAGDAPRAQAFARALLWQLVGLHSPVNLSLAVFCGPADSHAWEWLKWVPHTRPSATIQSVWPLAHTTDDSTRVLGALETLLAHRRENFSLKRSHPVTPIVVVMVSAQHVAESARLIALAEEGPGLGIHFIWLADSVSELPAACRTYVEIDADQAAAGFVRTGKRVALTTAESIEAAPSCALAKSLSAVTDRSMREQDESDLPRAVQLREHLTIDILGGAAAISEAWRRSDSVTKNWVPEREREPSPLTAVVGYGTAGPVALDLRLHGPHALVGGTTGSGKSEFLQTWIMSLAAHVSPDRVNFLLVDYKGGAAFAECAELPHAVGLVTDLTPHLVRRALTSLRAELRRREQCLANFGAKDLLTLERRSERAVPPALIIVIDEFASLAAEIPEFVDGVIDIAQRGRSLGLHLIMATQRPAGVIKDNLRANTNLRIALRMADEADSMDVIGAKDAALFPVEIPGRSAVKVGSNRLSHFQTGYLGGSSSNVQSESPVEIREFRFTEGKMWSAPVEPIVDAERAQTRDIEVLRDGIASAFQQLELAPPRRPWLDGLPCLIDLQQLLDTQESPRGSIREFAIVGLEDRPSEQSQPLAEIDFDAAGNIAVIGASGSGKTSALVTIAATLSIHAETSPVHIYAIDAANGALAQLATLPTVGAIAPLQDQELAERILLYLSQIVAERGARYTSAQANNLRQYRSRTGAQPKELTEARVVLLIDGFAAFRQQVETSREHQPLLPLLTEIMTNGRAVGVHVALSADRPSAIPSGLASTIQQQYVLRLASSTDYAALGIPSDALLEAPPGRAIRVETEHEMQFACIDASLSHNAPQAALELIGSRLHDSRVASAPAITNAPQRIALSTLPESHKELPTYGIHVETLLPVVLPTTGLAVIAGPPGSGVTQAMLTCIAAMHRWAKSKQIGLETALLSLEHGAVRRAVNWTTEVRSLEEISVTAASLAHSIRAANHSTPPREGEEISPAFPTPGKAGLIVVEHPSETAGNSAASALAALARAARRSNALVIFECESTTATETWEIFEALKRPDWGLSLQPDENSSPSPFRDVVHRNRRPRSIPGRGYAYEGGGPATEVQVALACE